MGFLSKSNLLLVLCCLCLNFGVAVDTIRSSQSIKDTDSNYIISNGSAFKLGFFSRVNSTNRYLGVWYNKISVFTVVWVANRGLFRGSYYIWGRRPCSIKWTKGDSLVIECYQLCCQSKCAAFRFREPGLARQHNKDNHMGRFSISY